MSTTFKNKRLIVSLITILTAISLFLPTQAYYLNTSKPITQGSNGFSCIYLLTFKHESLIPYLKTTESKKGLYLMDLPFIERNPDVVELLLQQKHTIGLITTSNIEEFNAATFEKELKQFTESTRSAPLWATSANGEFSEELLQASHEAAINILAANTYFNPSISASTLTQGSFLFITADQNFNFHSKKHIELVKSAQMRSIEENIFNMKIKEKSMP